MSQINTERTYTIIGRDRAEARFSVFPTGSLQIDLLHTLCHFRAPCNALRFESHRVAGSIDAVDITYTSDDKASVFWTVTIAASDAAELQSIIEASAESLKKLFGE
ncbi:hypothetical protein IZT72_29235 [Pseudomonas brenneri]|uniref:hypothetical protein n=1 Tax=Pseudomonas brenneri TaxID=129817 RepID=UPI0018A26349|nr:hypothetical protein [Pseudomonas brenneri]MBF8008675.1 hypothetical protein [Pseudomonas brenneri]